MKCADSKYQNEPQPPHVYIGETARVFRNRVEEHKTALENLEPTSFQVAHWATSHKDDVTCPTFKFKVLGKYSDALTRQISEAVNILEMGTLNKRCEFRVNDLCRLEPMKSIKDFDKERKLEIESSEMEENQIKSFIESLKEKGVNSNINSNSIFYRDRDQQEKRNLEEDYCGAPRNPK